MLSTLVLLTISLAANASPHSQYPPAGGWEVWSTTTITKTTSSLTSTFSTFSTVLFSTSTSTVTIPVQLQTTSTSTSTSSSTVTIPVQLETTTTPSPTFFTPIQVETTTTSSSTSTPGSVFDFVNTATSTTTSFSGPTYTAAVITSVINVAYNGTANGPAATSTLGEISITAQNPVASFVSAANKQEILAALGIAMGLIVVTM